MQEEWRNDETKCTFIVMDKTGEPGALVPVGDVNVFTEFHDAGEAEIDVMIAVPSSRRKGLASEAVRLMMHYAHRHLKVTRFIAKIKSRNVPSQNLFTRIGFRVTEPVNCFDEVTFAFDTV